MSRPEAAKAIEAILMVAQEPVDPHLLAQLLEIAPAAVESLCQQLQAGYVAEDRGFVLAKVAGGYRFQSHGDLAPYVERFVLEGQSARLSSAALETLAIVAYKQPLSRAQVAAIRGVNVDGVMRTLQQRGYVEEVGRDPGPGQATLFGTSKEFLERLGLNSLADLPPIADLFPSTDIMEALERGLRADRPEPEPAPDALPLDAASTWPAAPASDPTASLDLTDAAPSLDLTDAAPPATVHQDDVVDHGEVAAPEPDPETDPVGSSGRAAMPEPATTVEPVPVAGGATELDDDDDLQPPAWAVDPEPDPEGPTEPTDPEPGA